MNHKKELLRSLWVWERSQRIKATVWSTRPILSIGALAFGSLGYRDLGFRGLGLRVFRV